MFNSNRGYRYGRRLGLPLAAVALSLSIVGQPAFAGEAAVDRSVDSYLQKMMAQRRIAGLELAVIRNGKLYRTASYGYANLDFNIPVTSSTVFNVASITKALTGVAVMQLVEAGKLKLDKPIAAYLPDVPPRWRDVTARELLTHTSGLPDIMVNSYTTDVIADTPEKAIRLLRDRKLDFEPGNQWSYNQTNYMLLGLIIERLAGVPFVQFCQDRLFAPLKLHSATFGGSEAVVQQRATDYTPYKFDGPSPTILDRLQVLDDRMEPLVYPAGG